MENLKKKKMNKKYLVIADEEKTVFFTSKYIVKADNQEEARQKVLNNDPSIDWIEANDVDSDNYKFIEPENWEVKEI